MADQIMYTADKAGSHMRRFCTGVCYLLSQGLTERRSGMEWQIKL